MRDDPRRHGPYDRSVWECGVERTQSDQFRLRGVSRQYDFQLSYHLRRGYARDIDPGDIARYVDELVGSAFESWSRANVDSRRGYDMAQALWPHWQTLIGEFMTRIEYGVRRMNHPARVGERDYIADYAAPMVFWRRDFFNWGDLPREDPKAKEKAKQLLMRNLDAGQLKSFKAEGWFYVTGADGVRYKISTARSFNVEAADGTRYCGQITETPVEDQMLAQKLLLQSDPQEFISKCNVQPARQGVHDEWAVIDPIVIGARLA